VDEMRQEKTDSAQSVAGSFTQNNALVGIAHANPQSILDRWANGETLKSIASEYGVSQAAVTQWLNRHVDKEQREQARELHYECRLDAGLDMLEQAGDDVNLARAREPLLRRLEWRAEREVSHRWGQRPTTAINVGGDGMQVQIVSYAVAPTTHGAVLTPPDAVDAQVVPAQPVDSNGLVQSSGD